MKTQRKISLAVGLIFGLAIGLGSGLMIGQNFSLVACMGFVLVVFMGSYQRNFNLVAYLGFGLGAILNASLVCILDDWGLFLGIVLFIGLSQLITRFRPD